MADKEHPIWTVRPATPDDAAGYAHCYVESLAETYAHIMPPEFAASRRADMAGEVERTRAELERAWSALAGGRQPQRTHWVAVVPDGTGDGPVHDGEQVVGIVSAGPGVPHWEQKLYDNPAPQAAWNLDHLYTRRSTHGSGIGQRLFDVATTEVTDGRERPLGTWLWILRDNPRAEAFYRRNGLVPDGVAVACGPAWFGRPMFRMVRPDPA